VRLADSAARQDKIAVAAISSRLSAASERRGIKRRCRACCRRTAAQPNKVAAMTGRPDLPLSRPAGGCAPRRRSRRGGSRRIAARYLWRPRLGRLIGLALMATRRRLLSDGNCGGGRFSRRRHPAQIAAITAAGRRAPNA
jgi:hypothetical protein